MLVLVYAVGESCWVSSRREGKSVNRVRMDGMGDTGSGRVPSLATILIVGCGLWAVVGELVGEGYLIARSEMIFKTVIKPVTIPITTISNVTVKVIPLKICFVSFILFAIESGVFLNSSQGTKTQHTHQNLRCNCSINHWENSHVTKHYRSNEPNKRLNDCTVG